VQIADEGLIGKREGPDMSRYVRFLVAAVALVASQRVRAWTDDRLVGQWEPVRTMPNAGWEKKDAGWTTFTFAPDGKFEHTSISEKGGFSKKGTWSTSFWGRTLTIDESDEVLGREVNTFEWEIQGNRLKLVALTVKAYGHESYATYQDLKDLPVKDRTVWLEKTANLVK
jgi:hypothetical protein